MDLASGEDTSEEGLVGSQPLATLTPQVDRGYDSCDSEDLDTGFVWHRERNLADWLGLRKPWSGWKLEAIMTMRAHQVDFSSWVSGRRKWGIERRGPGRTKEDRQRDQLERETQGRHVQPVVLAEELAERRRRAHATDPVTDREAGREDGEDARSEGSHKHRNTGLQLGAAGEETAAPEPIVGTTTRGKRMRAHKPVVDAKRRREAVAAAFDDMDIDEDGPAPAGPAPFSAPEVEE